MIAGRSVTTLFRHWLVTLRLTRPRMIPTRGVRFQVLATIRSPCVAQENGVGKFRRSEPANAGVGLARTARYWCWEAERVGFSGSIPPRRPNERASTRVVSRAFQALLGGVRFSLSAPLCALALTACAHQPLTRSCITQKQYEQLKNAEPSKVHDKLTGKADEDVRPLAGSSLELRAWGHAMLDTLKICSTP